MKPSINGKDLRSAAGIQWDYNRTSGLHYQPVINSRKKIVQSNYSYGMNYGDQKTGKTVWGNSRKYSHYRQTAKSSKIRLQYVYGNEEDRDRFIAKLLFYLIIGVVVLITSVVVIALLCLK